MDGVFRIVQSIPSKKAEPFKHWLAQIGAERIQQMQDPELGIQQSLNPQGPDRLFGMAHAVRTGELAQYETVSRISATSTNRSRTRIWSEPSAATKKVAAPLPATAKSTKI